MNRVVFVDGTVWTWPSLALIRSWLLMLALGLVPGVGPSFLACWIVVSLIRVFHWLLTDS